MRPPLAELPKDPCCPCRRTHRRALATVLLATVHLAIGFTWLMMWIHVLHRVRRHLLDPPCDPNGRLGAGGCGCSSEIDPTLGVCPAAPSAHDERARSACRCCRSQPCQIGCAPERMLMLPRSNR